MKKTVTQQQHEDAEDACDVAYKAETSARKAYDDARFAWEDAWKIRERAFEILKAT